MNTHNRTSGADVAQKVALVVGTAFTAGKRIAATTGAGSRSRSMAGR